MNVSSSSFGNAEIVVFAQAEFVADSIILENATGFHHFNDSFSFAEIVVFDYNFSPIYIAPESIIFGNMFSRAEHSLLSLIAVPKARTEKLLFWAIFDPRDRFTHISYQNGIRSNHLIFEAEKSPVHPLLALSWSHSLEFPPSPLDNEFPDSVPVPVPVHNTWSTKRKSEKQGLKPKVKAIKPSSEVEQSEPENIELVKPVPAPTKIVFMIPVGCVSVEGKPTLAYKFSTANKNATMINLRTEEDWDGLVSDVLAKMKTKKDISINIFMLPENTSFIDSGVVVIVDKKDARRQSDDSEDGDAITAT
ncbi:hypothetical protein DFH07DRAFT_771827 [Mycena maculata]|uniref:Uncharacterized protein n=1 Tax=Mycena maculata TaxID=230809 RepID=A0AAD7J9K1_9AGAR|nr:hypothetical protein DFH07DRAFT_771827 [Mycena maculata]